MHFVSIYLNQHASNTSFQYWKEQITRSLFRSNLIFHTPKNLEELNRELNQDIEKGVDAIISVGGDGTVNTLIQNLAGTKIGLLVIAGGTANDLAHELGTQKNLKNVIQCIRANETKDIDLIKVNDRFMATNGGIGIGGVVAEKINHIRKRYPIFKKLMKLSGKNIYTLFAASEILSLSKETYSLQLTSEEYTGQIECAALLVNNQPVLAGRFHVAPMTSNEDGQFNVVILSHSNRHKLIRCLYSISQGKIPNDDPDFISFEAKSLTIENLRKSQKINFFGDGEILSEGEDFWRVCIKERALRVFSKCSDFDFVDLGNEVNLE